MPGKEQESAWATSKDAAEQLGKLPENAKKAGDSMVNMARKADAADHQLRQLANLAFPERDMSGRKQGMEQLDKIIVSAGGGRDDAAAALTTLLQNGIKLNDAEKILPQLVNGGQALGVSAQKLAEAAVASGGDKKNEKDQATQAPDADKINKNLRLALAEAAAKPSDYHPDDASKWLPDLLKKVEKTGVSQENLNRYDNNVQMMRESAQFKDQSQQSALANSEQNKKASQILGDQKANYSEIVAPLLDCAAALLTFGSALAGVVSIVGKLTRGADASPPSLPSKSSGKKGKGSSNTPASKKSPSTAKTANSRAQKSSPAKPAQASPPPRASTPSRASTSGSSPGIFSKLATKTKGFLQKTVQSGKSLPDKLRSLAGPGGNALKKSSGVLGSVLKGGLKMAGKASGVLGLATGAIGAYQMLTDPNATIGNKVRAVSGQLGNLGGSAIGSVVGGAIGMLGGPVGVALGTMAGRALGGWLGETLGDKAGSMLGNKIDNKQTAASKPASAALAQQSKTSAMAAASPPAVAKPTAPQPAAAKTPPLPPKGKGDGTAASLLPQLQALVNQFSAAITQFHQPLHITVDVQNGNIVAAVNAANSKQQRRN
ncbi:hypothetical protein [Chromobacterium sp. IIBBL 290-4]|uniref:hypothetical protein n=1 Tax=Chromobacterium sp. IIBBL 290-4 TaxID=2953890 RepID=UPI0020B87706|nr:hypothetical protein [Chromobacterium sp. IIBBL 290-4]UTH76021.1 hypothetical protein NKT35_07915 [Chromobacterium sp. IIBBL 290-4]